MLPTHQMFIDLIAQGFSQSEAYRQTICNNCSKKTVKSNGYHVARKYKQQIQEQKQKYAGMHQLNTQLTAGIKTPRLTIEEVDAKLSAYVRGQAKLSPSDLLKALDMYYKRFGSYNEEPRKIAAIIPGNDDPIIYADEPEFY